MRRHAIPRLAVAIMLLAAGCGNTLREKAYHARLAFNVSARLVIIARKAKYLDDATYVAAYEVMKEGQASLADLDARVARIAAIEADTTLSDDAKKAAIAREENGFDIALGVLDRLVPLLDRWQAQGLDKPGPSPPAPSPAPAQPTPAEAFPEPAPPVAPS